MKPTHPGKRRSRRFIPAAIVAATVAATADLPPVATAGAYDEMTIAVVETRPCDTNCRTPDNPGGWIETRLGDEDEGVASRIDTCSERGTVFIFR